MRVHFATLAQASVFQLRDALRRVTTLHSQAEAPLDELEFPAGGEAGDSAWGDWEDTSFDVRTIDA